MSAQAPDASQPALCRLQARGPEGLPDAWSDVDTWENDENWERTALDALESPPRDFVAGTSLRVLLPEGVVWPELRIVGADGVARRPSLPGNWPSCYEFGGAGVGDVARDPVDWWFSAPSRGRKERWEEQGAHYMLRLAAGLSSRGSELRRVVVRTFVSIADFILDPWEEEYPESDQPRLALDAAWRWCDGEATEGEVWDAGLMSWVAFEGIGKDTSGQWEAVGIDAPRGAACVAALVSLEGGDTGAVWGCGTGGWDAGARGYLDIRLRGMAGDIAFTAFSFIAGYLEIIRFYRNEEMFRQFSQMVREFVPLREVLVALARPAPEDVP